MDAKESSAKFISSTAANVGLSVGSFDTVERSIETDFIFPLTQQAVVGYEVYKTNYCDEFASDFAGLGRRLLFRIPLWLHLPWIDLEPSEHGRKTIRWQLI